MGTINIYSGNGANKAGLTYNGSSDITVDTEHLANTSSSIQSQLDAKLPSAGGTLTGALAINSGTANTGLTITSTDAASWLTMTDPTASLFFGNTGGEFALWTGGAEALRVDGDGKVGIGTSSPASKLHIKTSTNFNYEFEEVSSKLRLSALNDARTANVPLQFAASEFNLISGNVGIGTTSPYRKLTLSSAFGGSAEDLLDLQSSTAGGGTAPMIRFGTWALNSNTLGRMGFVDNPDYGGDFVVETNSSSTATDATTEKFRVNKDGNVSMVGTLSFASSGLVSLGSSSKQTIALPNDGGITIGSGYTFANIYGTGGNLHLRANSYIANTGTPSEIILSTANSGGGSSPDVTVKEGYLSSKKGTIQTVLNQTTLYTSINPVNTWAEAHSNFRVSITPRYSSGTKILGTFSIPINPQGASNILMAMNPWYSTDGGTTKTLLNQGGPAGSRVSGSHAWFRSSNGYDLNDMQNHIIHFGHIPGATTTLTFGFYFRSEGSNTTYFCHSGGNNGTWGWTAPVYMELREVEVA